MRTRLIALALLPLVGLSLFAALWALERFSRSETAADQQRVTKVVTNLAELMLAIDISERTTSVHSPLTGTLELVAGAARSEARKAVVERRRDLQPDGALVDALVGRRGAWAETARKVDASMAAARQPADRAAPPVTDGLVGRSAADGGLTAALAAETGVDGRPRVRIPESVAALSALQRLLDDIATSPRAEHDTAALMARAVQLQAASNNEVFAVLVRMVRDDWHGAANDLLRAQFEQRGHLRTIQALMPDAQRPLLYELMDAARWTRFIAPVRARALGSRRAHLPDLRGAGPLAIDRVTRMSRFPTRLGAALRKAAAARSDQARAQARTALLAALVFLVATVALTAVITGSIGRPLRRLEARARGLSLGDVAPATTSARGDPRETVVVARALDDLAANAAIIQAQASALAEGDTKAPVLRTAAPGPIGESLRRSVENLSAVSEQLRASEALSRAIVATAADAIWTVGADGRIRTENPAAVRLLGGAGSIGAPVAEALGVDIAGPEGAPVAVLANDEVWLRRPGGARIPVLVSTSCTGGAGEPLWTVFARDISVLKEYEARLSHQAFHDELTGLPNRVLLLDRMEHALARGRRAGGARIALLMVDLDDFKSVNDVLGHAAGDELLVAVAERLRTCLRPGDTAARLGGDEFAVLLDDVVDPAEADAVARRIVDLLALPLPAGGTDLAVAASVGIRLSDADATPQTLLRDADTAMYSAKAAGKGRTALFTASMLADATRRLVLRTDLADALAGDQLRLVYQPVIDLATHEIVAAEALLRWDHPVHGTVSPADFVPTAEETGLIVPIGRWVLVEACRAAAAWPVPIAVNVNLSGVQLLHDDAVEAVREALAVTGLAPHRLVVELTESVLLKDVEGVAGILRALKALGVAIAIDDFGTGYCSLAYLKRFPVDHLKIDRAFTEDLTTDRSLARSIIDLAGVLGLSAVAEGVETAEQAEVLRSMACDLAQGFHFAEPLTEGELVALLDDGVTATAA